MPVGYFGQGLFVGRVAVGAGLLDPGIELEFLVQHDADLAGRGKVERRLTGHLACLLLDLRELLRQDAAVLAQHLRVDLHARGFHPGQDADQRHLDAGVQVPEMLLLQLRDQERLDQAGGDAFPAARLVFEVEEHHLAVLRAFRQVHVQIGGAEGLEFVAAFRIEQVVHQFDVVERSLEDGVLEPESALLHGRV